MRCNNNNILVNSVKELTETTDIVLSDRFVVETNTGGTRSFRFESFNLNLNNTTFENEFNQQTTDILSLSSRLLENGVTTVAVEQTEDVILSKYNTYLQQVSALQELNGYYCRGIEDILNTYNPDGTGIIKKVSIAVVVQFPSNDGNYFQTIDRVVNNTIDAGLSAFELVTERDFNSNCLSNLGIPVNCAQSAGINVNIENNNITLTPSAKAIGQPVQSALIRLTGIQQYSDAADIIDFSRIGNTLFDGVIVEPVDQFITFNVLDFSYSYDRCLGILDLKYTNSGNPGELKFSSESDAADTFEIITGDDSKIATQDINCGVIIDPVTGDVVVDVNCDQTPATSCQDLSYSNNGALECQGVNEPVTCFVKLWRKDPNSTAFRITNGDRYFYLPDDAVIAEVIRGNGGNCLLIRQEGLPGDDFASNVVDMSAFNHKLYDKTFVPTSTSISDPPPYNTSWQFIAFEELDGDIDDL